MAERDAHIDYELIAKYLAGEAQPAEEKNIEAWLNDSEENRQFFVRMKMLWEHTGRILPHEEADVDVDEGWNKFSESILKSPSSNKVRKLNTQHPEAGNSFTEVKSHSLIFRLSRIAAVLVLGFGLYWIFENITGTQEVILSAVNETVTDTLQDGSVVSLNIRSQLTHPKSFKAGKREVSLKGEAFFEVESMPQKPFVVEVEGALITVLGTSFYVNAYDSLDIITIGVQDGRVQVNAENSDEIVILEKGESLTVNKSSAELTPQPYEPNETYWKTKTLIFQNKRLSEVFQDLETLYNVDIEVENQQILSCSLTAKFYSEDLDQIFELINTNFNLTATHEDNRIIISGVGCD